MGLQLPRRARLELCVIGHGPGKIPKPPTPADGEGHGNEGGDEEVNILNLPLPEVNFDAFDGTLPHPLFQFARCPAAMEVNVTLAAPFSKTTLVQDLFNKGAAALCSRSRHLPAVYKRAHNCSSSKQTTNVAHRRSHGAKRMAAG